ncbi:MAG: Gfo/Idh/MocA family oxidoreductase [Sedimentisphaerales bacterium]|nr:Gfo/Idh/MocA family oxidoreductase [Sedimentisphaerales bacterium]
MLNIGIIGMSKGNGHPYSWSAIINGDYKAALIDQAIQMYNYIGISQYLAANRDTLGIDGAKVTHIWTQDRKISEHIAAASMIDNVVDNLEDMIGKVDGVLLARDDPENHVAMARPFLDADVPLFIDKPLAITWEDLDYFSKQHAKGKFLMSCSSMRYSPGNQSARVQLDSVGKIELVVVVGKKDWRKYAIHYLEGMFSLLGDPKAVAVKHITKSGKDIAYIEFENGILATVHVFMDIAPGGELNVYGQKGNLQVVHGGAYTSFRSTLVEAIRSFEQGKSRLDFEKTRNVISTLIAGQESLDKGGKTILLKEHF